jgi:predicted transcriptional regulator
LAEKLKTGQALIARIELGGRRADLVELHSILEALGVDSGEEIRRIVSGFNEGS